MCDGVRRRKLRILCVVAAAPVLGLPGRKNLIWFSGSFPVNFTPDYTQENPFKAVADYQDDVRKTTDLLVRSQVAVYPIDGRGPICADSCARTARGPDH